MYCHAGFKLGPIVGEVLADLATGVNPKFDMSHFKLSNFQKPGAKL
jgi:glycine/D-amino acid oxidase-like deaminating enzyme